MVVITDSSFLGLDWAAIEAIATLVAGAVALVQVWRWRQESRWAHKPVLGLHRAVIDRDGRIRVWLHNEGLGPALNIRFSAWIRPADRYLRGPELIDAGRAHWSGLNRLQPEHQGQLPAIGAGQRDVSYYVGRRSDLATAGGWGVMVYAFELQDIYGRWLPTMPPARRAPGYISIIPDWDSEFTGRPLEGESEPEAVAQVPEA